jgi:tetratricopeptide (TPR) repeat protein
MSHEPPAPDPPPLRDEPGASGALLREGEAEFRRGLDEPRAFRRGTRTRQRRAAASWSVAVGVWATVLLWLAGTNTSTPWGAPGALSVSAEKLNLAPLREPSPVVPALAVSATALPARRASPPAPPLSSVQAPAAFVSEAECRAELAANKPERAVACFRARSREPGVKGEVASYEAARLAFERLNDPARALPWLEEHRQRFPNGALRGEVDWLRVRSLEHAGRFREALAASETLLASPEGRTLNAELHLLRARIHADAHGDCGEAVSELVALIGEPSARGDEAELRRAACLEKLGRHADAIAAYKQYLARAKPKRAAQAQERLDALEH